MSISSGQALTISTYGLSQQDTIVTQSYAYLSSHKIIIYYKVSQPIIQAEVDDNDERMSYKRFWHAIANIKLVGCGWENPGTMTCHDVSTGSHIICT